MINEDINQVLSNLKSEIFRDLRVASIAKVTAVDGDTVTAQLLVADVSNGIAMDPPEIVGLRVVGSSMPSVGRLGIVLHLDRRNMPQDGKQVSGGPAHEIGFGVFLPLVESGGGGIGV